MIEIFKQNKSFLTRAKEKSYIKYVLDFDSVGAYIQIKDKTNRVLTNLDFRVYNGNDRKVLQQITMYEEKNFYHIDWENNSDQIYLYKYPKVLELLKKSDNFYYQNEPLLFAENKTKIIVSIIENNNMVYINSSINGEIKYKFLTQNMVLIDNTIYKIEDIGDNYNSFSLFNTTLQLNKLEEYLTILLTHYENIDIKYKDYDFVIKEEKKLIKPAIIFEKVTSDDELILRVSATYSGINPEFFSDYNITKIVSVNEYEKQISLYEADFSDVFEVYSDVFKYLTMLKKETKASFSEEDGLFIIEANIAKEFIQKHLQQFISNSHLYGSENLKAYKYNTSTPRLNITFGDKIDYLGINDITVSIGDDNINIIELLNLHKKHQFIPLSNGEKAIIDEAYIQKLQRLFKKTKDKIKVSFFDLAEIEELISKKEQTVFVKSRQFYSGFEKLKETNSKLPKLNATLRDYQKYGIRWLKYLYDSGFGGCLADDMGLGKTLQTIGLLSYIYPKAKKPTLIIIPKSLLSNWQNELDKFNNTLKYYLYYGNNRNLDNIKDYHIIISTYAVIRNDIEIIKDVEFDTIILDESQNIKNIDSQISKAVALLEAKHKFALSGTPIENSLYELYSLFRFINSGMFSSVSAFRDDYMLPISQNDTTVANALRVRISPFVLRRLKSDVLKDLPPKQEQIIYVDMDEEQKKLYNAKRDYYKQTLIKQIDEMGFDGSKFAIFSAFNELRQIASLPSLKSDSDISSSKLDCMFDMLSDIIANNHKVLIFVNYLGVIDAIAQKAQDMGIEYLSMSGSTRDRQEVVDKFQNNKRYSLLIMTLKVGGVGLNLTSADYVFIYDPWWNKSAENQAIDRAHRIGQTNKVFSYKMITKDTIEEKILQLQNQKQELSDMLIASDDGLKNISKQDLEYLLG